MCRGATPIPGRTGRRHRAPQGPVERAEAAPHRRDSRRGEATCRLAVVARGGFPGQARRRHRRTPGLRRCGGRSRGPGADIQGAGLPRRVIVLESGRFQVPGFSQLATHGGYGPTSRPRSSFPPGDSRKRWHPMTLTVVFRSARDLPELRALVKDGATTQRVGARPAPVPPAGAAQGRTRRPRAVRGGAPDHGRLTRPRAACSTGTVSSDCASRGIAPGACERCPPWSGSSRGSAGRSPSSRSASRRARWGR